MPSPKIKSSNRARNAIASVMATATLIAGVFMSQSVPASAQLAVVALIIPWEGLVLQSHWDKYAKIWDICYGETKGIHKDMTKTEAQCRTMLMTRVVNDYYKPLTRCIKGFDKLPTSLQASLISGAYNFGVGAQCKSSAVRFATAGQYNTACLAQTAFNKAGGQVVKGLVLRREMGDAQRIGEAELCVSGL